MIKVSFKEWKEFKPERCCPEKAGLIAMIVLTQTKRRAFYRWRVCMVPHESKPKDQRLPGLILQKAIAKDSKTI